MRKAICLVLGLCAVGVLVSASFASEPRLITLGAMENPLIFPEDDLDVYLFPHALAHKNKFVYGDPTSEYVTYSGANFIFSIGRENSELFGGKNTNPRRPEDPFVPSLGPATAPIVDVGFASELFGVIGHVGFNDVDGNSALFEAGIRASAQFSDLELALGFDVLDNDETDSPGVRGQTGVLFNLDGRYDFDNQYFNLIVGHFDISDDFSAPGGTNVGGSIGIAYNDEVRRNTRLIYGISAEIRDLEDVATTFKVPTVIGVEQEITRWLTVRAGGTKVWRVDDQDKSNAQLQVDPPGDPGVSPDEVTAGTISNVRFGVELARDGFTLDFLLLNSFLEDGAVFERDAFAEHTSLTYHF